MNLDWEIRVGGKVGLDVQGREGADTWVLSVNDVLDNAEVSARFDGAAGNDTFHVCLGDPVEAGGRLRIEGYGGAGHDAMTVDATTFGKGADVAAGAELEILLQGGQGNDTLGVSLAGVVSGDLRLHLDGGVGHDAVTAEVQVSAGSTGNVQARILGGVGNDALTLLITDLSAGAAEIDALINGGSGFDTAVATPNVDVINCEA